jgi:hypothetical protein
MRTRYKRDRVRAKRDHIKNIVKPQPKLIVPAVRDNQLGLGLIEPPRLIKRNPEAPRYVMSLDGPRLIQRSTLPPRLTEERVWAKIDSAKLGVTNVVKAKRGRKRNRSLKRGQ